MRIRTVFIMAALAICVNANCAKKAVVASTIQLPEHELLYNEGIELLQKGEFDDAVLKFSASVSIDSTFTKAYYNRAVAYYNLEKYNKAVNDINIAIRQSTDVTDIANAHILKGKIHYAIGDIDNAISEIDEALELDPANIAAMLDKAAIQQSSEKYADAIEMYNQILYRSNGNKLALNELGNCYSKTGNRERALECYKKAYSSDTTDITTKYNLAVTYFTAKGDTATSLKLLDELIESDVTNAAYYNAKGYIFSTIGDYGKALAAYDVATTIDKNMYQAYLGKGVALYNNGEYDEAVKQFTKAIDANNNFSDAYVNRGIAKEALADYDGACVDFRKASDLGSKTGTEYYTKQCK